MLKEKGEQPMKIGICAWVLPVKEIEAIPLAKHVGLEGITIDYGDENKGFVLRDEAIRAAYLEAIQKHDMDIPTMALNLLCQRGMTKKENHGFVKEVLNESIEIAHLMGIPKLQIPSFYDNLIRTEEDLDNTIDMFQYACHLGSQYDIVIGSESVMTIKQHEKFYQEVHSKYLTTIFDTQNPWRMLNQDGLKMAKYMAPFTGELHAKDSHTNGPFELQLGEGDVDCTDIMRFYAAAGYNGWIQLESAYGRMQDYERILMKDIKRIKEIWR